MERKQEDDLGDLVEGGAIKQRPRAKKERPKAADSSLRLSFTSAIGAATHFRFHFISAGLSGKPDNHQEAFRCQQLDRPARQLAQY